MRRYLILFPMVLFAETPPCGVSIVRTGGSAVEDRFIPASPEHVKASVLRALPAMAGKVHKDKGMELEARTDEQLAIIMSRQNSDQGQRGMFAGRGAWGTYRIRLAAETRDGKPGTRTHVEFHKNKLNGRMGSNQNATPLMEEIACLATTLSPRDPVANPRGPGEGGGGGTLPKSTPVKLVMRDFFYSKQIKKGTNPEIGFEVGEDVSVEGRILIRRGALGKGRLTSMQHAKGYGRHAKVEFLLESAVAVDGQTVKLTAPSEASKGGRKNDTATTALMLPTLGWMVKGNEVLIRAGTAYEAEVEADQSIGAAK